MRIALIGFALLAVGTIALVSGTLPVSEAVALFDRVWPILAFVVSITIATELAAEAGLFDYIARKLARWGRGRAILLWLMVVLFATAGTVFLSLDTAAVLLTPIVVVLARQSGLNPLPFAISTVWLANTASLLLPVSNLTNLLAENRLGGIGPIGFAALTWAPAVAAVLVPVTVIAVVYRKSLFTNYAISRADPIDDRVLLRWAALIVALLIPALVSGMPVWMPATAAAVSLGTVFAVRRPRTLRFALVPWQLVVFASGLFLVMEAGHAVGLTELLSQVSGTGNGSPSLLRLAGIGAAGANLFDNLPAYLALEPVADSPRRLIALLVGVNVGPLITPWASLATLLWHQRLSRLGVAVSWWRYAALGAIVAPIAVAASVLAMSLVLG